MEEIWNLIQNNRGAKPWKSVEYSIMTIFSCHSSFTWMSLMLFEVFQTGLLIMENVFFSTVVYSPRIQVLAKCRSHWWDLWRSKLCVHMSTNGVLWITVCWWLGIFTEIIWEILTENKKKMLTNLYIFAVMDSRI